MADLDCGIPFNNVSLSKKSSLCDENKLSCVLTRILNESYSFSDDTILDKLYSYLSEKAKKDDFINKEDVLIPWLSSVVEKWDKLKKNIKTFAVQMARIVASTSDGLQQLISRGLLMILCKYSRNSDDVSIIVAFVEMLSEVVGHVQGCIWFLKLDLQSHVLKLLHDEHSIYVTRSTKELIIKLVLALHKYDIESCQSVIDGIIKSLNLIKLNKELPSRQDLLSSVQNFIAPYGNFDIYSSDLMPKSEINNDCQAESDLKNLTESKSDGYNEKIIPTVQLLCSLIDSLIDSGSSAKDINMIFRHYNLYLWAWEKLYAENDNYKVISSLSTLITYLNFSTVPQNDKKLVPESDLIDTLKGLLCLTQLLTHKRQYVIVNNICVLSQMLTQKLITSTMFLCKEDGVTYNFRAQILSLHAMPIFVFVRVARFTHSDVSDKFADKLFNLICMQVKRVCYQYRDTLRSCPECNTQTWLRSSIQTLSSILKYLHKEHVVVVFQSFMHLLREFVPDEYTNMTDVITVDKFELVNKYPNLVMDLLDGIGILIKNYNITWSESLETVCVLVLLISLSCISDLSIPLSTKLLKLIELAISSFIPPNLALLVENIKDSSLENLGPLLLRKLHSVHWEIRDSALEVLQTVASLSKFKFPAFQNIILESDFPSVLFNMAECDEESYVRASAIVCLQKMVHVERLWDEALSNKMLVEKMLDCLKSEPEGIVRKEAVSLVSAVFIDHDLSESLIEKVHKQLLHAAISDLHWEVKVNALSFWDAAIDHETAYQGMIDGVFPAVTFSQKSKKIVNLTPVEVQKRLKLVLDDLQKNGCLQVLWMTLNDTSDLEVARKSVAIINKLLQLLQQYGVVEETCGRATVIPSVQGMVSEIDEAVPLSFLNSNDQAGCSSKCGTSSRNEKVMIDSDDIIKSITESQDIELLSTVYCKDNKKINHDMKKSNEFEKGFITVNEFIDSVSTLNLESIIKTRTDWLNASDDLDSLMNDILAVSVDSGDEEEGKDVNAKDCY